MSPSQNTRQISVTQKVLISLVTIGPGVINSLVVNSLLIYYTDKLGMKNIILYGIAIMIYGIWNGINNPIIGVYVERWNPPNGKQKLKSLMKFGMPIMFLGFLCFILPPPGSPDWVLFTMLLVGLIIFELGKAITEVAALTFSIMIVTEPTARSNLVMVMKILEFIPLALLGIIPVIFLAPGRPYWHALLFILIVCISMFGISYKAIFKIEEPDDLYQISKPISSPQESIDEGNQRSSISAPVHSVSPRQISNFTLIVNLRATFKSIISTLNSKPFLFLITYIIFGSLFQAAFSSNIIFMINWVVPVESDLLKIVILGIGGLLINVYYVIQSILVKKMQMFHVIYLFFAFGFIGYIILFFANSFILLALGYWVANMGLAAFYMFINVMIGDVGDHALVESGKNRYSEFTANISVFSALGPAITSFLITVVLQMSGYIGESIASQSNSAILGIRIIACILPMIGLSICALLLKNHPLQGKYYQDMRRKFNELKQHSSESS